jgi:phage I-like protein
VTTTAPTEIRIFRAGVNRSEKGDFLFDAQAAESVLREYARHAKPAVFDFNHGTTLSDPTPEQGIAAGRFVPEVRNGELWATAIKWTARAAALLEAREYVCFSPYFEHDVATGRVLRLINIALTNLPALDDIAELMAASATRRAGQAPAPLYVVTPVSPERRHIAKLCNTPLEEIEAWEAEQRRR